MLVFKDRYSTKNTKTRPFYKRPYIVVVLVLVVAGIVLAVLEFTNTTHLFHKATPASEVVVHKGTSFPTPKNNSSAGSSKAKAPTSSSGRVISGGTDTNGSASASTNSSQWTVSASGAITVKQPVVNATLQSGAVLSGSAKVSKVNFRLIDNQIGVISEGSLNVVNGNFSGTINFATHSSTGRLDVFSTDASGVELNEVQLSVRF